MLYWSHVLLLQVLNVANVVCCMLPMPVQTLFFCDCIVLPLNAALQRAPPLYHRHLHIVCSQTKQNQLLYRLPVHKKLCLCLAQPLEGLWCTMWRHAGGGVLAERALLLKTGCVCTCWTHKPGASSIELMCLFGPVVLAV
jgi:hypothetical protein